jgi:hypothetical protein
MVCRFKSKGVEADAEAEEAEEAEEAADEGGALTIVGGAGDI